MEDLHTKSARVIPLANAATQFGVTDITEFKASVKRIGALVSVAGIDFVDTDRLMEAVATKSERTAQLKVARSARPKASQRPGQRIGLIRARLGRAPKLIANKEKAIKAAELAIAAAKNPYETRKAQRTLDSLQSGLKDLQDMQRDDEKDLDAILNDTQAA